MTLSEYEINDYLEHFENLYSIKFIESLSPDYYNISRALEVYREGITKGLTLRKAVISIFGYRYRRMENFVQELGLYDTKTHEWLHKLVLVKLRSEYKSHKKGAIVVEFELETLIPFTYFISEEKEESKGLLQILNDAIDRTDFSGIQIDMIITGFRTAFIDYELMKHNECEQQNDFTLVIKVRKYCYQYFFNLRMHNYFLLGFRKNECKEFYDVELKSERPYPCW